VQHEYTVLFSTVGRMSLPAGRGCRFDYGPASPNVKTIIIQPLMIESTGFKSECGLSIHVMILAADIKAAIETAAMVASGVSLFSSVCGNAALNDPFLMLVYDSTPDISERDFRQYFYPASPLQAARTIGHDYLLQLFTAWTNTVTRDPSLGGRIAQAIGWYGHSLKEENPAFRFLSAWFALENVDWPLRVKFHSTHTKTLSAKCSFCMLNPSSHIQEEITHWFDDARSARNLLAHYGAQFDPVKFKKQLATVHTTTPLLLSLVAKSLFVLVDQYPELAKRPDDALWRSEDWRSWPVVYQTSLLEKDVSQLGKNGTEPHVDIEFHNKGPVPFPDSPSGYGIDFSIKSMVESFGCTHTPRTIFWPKGGPWRGSILIAPR